MDVVTQGAVDAARDRASNYISDQTLQRLSDSWRGQSCVALAHAAQTILHGRYLFRKGVSHLLEPVFDFLEQRMASSGALRHVFELPVLRLVSQRIAARLARVVAQEISERMARNLTIADRQLTATARAIQMTGIGFCLMQERDLRMCACFKEMALREGKEKVKQIILTAMDNWTSLGQFRTDDSTPS